MNARVAMAWTAGRWAVPNGITLTGLASGMAALAYAGADETAKAVICVLIAAVLDALDGRAARQFNCQSHFGAELDSLSDVVCFGAAPAYILHQWGLKELGLAGWLACLAVVAAAALRLARFNVGLTAEKKPVMSALFFTGVPAPAGAFLAMLPIYLAQAQWMSLAQSVTFAVFLLPTVAALMVSTLPTFSGKTLGRFATARWLMPSALAVSLGLYGLFTAPWMTFTLAALAYLLTLPLSLWRHQRISRRS
jgi:CDP-diacylglycerol---serine O-phosphatidyltransferase